MPDPTQESLHACLTAFRAARFGEAEELARTVVARAPQLALGWKLLGATLQSRGEKAGTLTAMARAAALAPLDAEAHSNLAGILAAVGRFDDAKSASMRALEINPNYAEAHGNLGTALLGLGDAEGAETSQRRAVALKPDLAEAHSKLGSALKMRHRPDEAETCFRHALELKPDLVEAIVNLAQLHAERGDHSAAQGFYRRALRFTPQDPGLHNALGNTLLEEGRLDEAEACYRRAISLKSDLAEPHGNLGSLLLERGQAYESIALHQKAIALKPSLMMSYCNIARAYAELGDYDRAEQGYRHVLETNPAFPAARAGYVDLLSRRPIMRADEFTCAIIARALEETWINPMKLARAAGEVLKLRLGVDRAGSEPARSDLVERLAAEPLVYPVLRSTLVIDETLEAILTRTRQWLLERLSTPATSHADESYLDLTCALAQQCFINEYVYARTQAEDEQADAIANSVVAALDSGASIPAMWVATLACYAPLHALPEARRLLLRQWPDPVHALLRQQIEEPFLEISLRETIPRLTAIADGVSSRVRRQYEESPYPRWMEIPAHRQPLAPGAYLKRKFPNADVPEFEKARPLEILIAGCGTGHHAITASRHYRSAHILAIDLSLTSLAFAKRKTQEMGIDSIDYAQADITEMGSLGRSFDIIETSGVLHHLADPFAGWRILLSLLRPGGVMKVGLYSAIGRRRILAMQESVGDHRKDLTAASIRQARQRLRELGLVTRDSHPLPQDFYSTSACRDLLFHEQEHNLSLDRISAFLEDNDLRVLGFEIDPTILRAYHKRFPDDPPATRLDRWQVFENENPRVFAGMYQFWVAKPAV